MNRTPLIDIQRSQTIIGEIRSGGEQQEKMIRGQKKKVVGPKLESWRLTSAQKGLLDEAAGLYGGEVKPWHSPAGERWQLETERASLPVLVMPEMALTCRYELWEGLTKRSRICDGVEEEISQGGCICNADGFAGLFCDLYSRLTVMLPELTTMLGWRLITKSETAARELPASLEIARAIARGPFVSANLILTQRRSVKDGQTVRFVVPVLDLATGYAALARRGAAGELEAGGVPPLPPAGPPAGPEERAALPSFEPVPPGKQQAGVGLKESLDQLGAKPEKKTKRGREAEPVGTGDVEDHVFGTGPLVPEDEPEVGASAEGDTPRAAPDPTPDRDPELLSEEQARELDKLVGPLRKAGHITTEQLWATTANARTFDSEEMIELLHGRDEEGELHWAPLRDSLDPDEAESLRQRLARHFARTMGDQEEPNE